jgi:MFS family permease
MRSSDARTTVAIALGTVFAVYFAQAVVFVAIPLAAERIGLSPLLTGLLLAIPGAISLLVDVPVAAYSDGSRRRKTLLRGGVTLLVGGMILMVQDAWMLATGVAVYGLAMAALAAPSLALVTESAPFDEQPRIQGWNGSAQALAAMVGGALAGALLVGGTSVAFVAVAFAALGVLLLVLPVRERQGPSSGTNWRSSYMRAIGLLRLPGMRSVGVLAVAYGVIFLVVGNAFVPLYLVTTAGYSPAIVGLLLAVRPVVVLLISPLFSRISHRWGVETPLGLVTALAGVGIAIVPFVSGEMIGVVVAMALQGLGIALSAAGANVLVAAVTQPAERATGIAVTNLGSRLTVLLVPPALGAVYGGLGPEAAFVLGGLIVVACAAALLRDAGHLRPELA